MTVHTTQSGHTYLNFGADYPHQTFSGAVLGAHGPGLARLDTLQGRRIGVTGVIKLYKGVAEIVIESGGQITAQ